MEAENPVLEPTVEGIDVLDVIDAGNDAPAGRNIDRAMGHPDLFGGSGEDATAVSAKDRV
jgi:hypothetical protein